MKQTSSRGRGQINEQVLTTVARRSDTLKFRTAAILALPIFVTMTIVVFRHVQTLGTVLARVWVTVVVVDLQTGTRSELF